jgi:hypothetical protein
MDTSDISITHGSYMTIIEEAYCRNKIDVNKYINTKGYGFDLS